jgi:hypothetical protein
MQKKIKKLKSELRYGDMRRIAYTLCVSLPTIRKAFKKECGFSDTDIKIYKEVSRIINERKNIIKKL